MQAYQINIISDTNSIQCEWWKKLTAFLFLSIVFFPTICVFLVSCLEPITIQHINSLHSFHFILFFIFFLFLRLNLFLKHCYRFWLSLAIHNLLFVIRFSAAGFVYFCLRVFVLSAQELHLYCSLLKLYHLNVLIESNIKVASCSYALNLLIPVKWFT